jgi:hypothetical protein
MSHTCYAPLLVCAGLCRAHGIPHQSVTTPQELPAALATAWGINRHSVVEVITDRWGWGPTWLSLVVVEVKNEGWSPCFGNGRTIYVCILLIASRLPRKVLVDCEMLCLSLHSLAHACMVLLYCVSLPHAEPTT